MNIKQLIILVLFSLLCLSCEDDETNKLAAAQNCLDESNASTANQCLDYIEGLTSKDSYVIRCSADFISAGITPEKLAEAIINRDSTSTSKSPVLGMMGAFSFSTGSAAEQAYSNCELSGVNSFVLFASLARIATTLAEVGNLLSVVQAGGTLSQSQMESIITDLQTNQIDDEKAANIGASAVSISSEYCSQDGADEKVCGKVSDAIDSGDSDAEIGRALIDALNTN